MSHPWDEFDTDRENCPFDDGEETVVSFDIYGVRGKVGSGGLGKEKPPASAKSVWARAVHALKRLFVDAPLDVIELIADVPRTARAVLGGMRAVATIPRAIAHRITHGRTRAEHRENEAIAKVELRTEQPAGTASELNTALENYEVLILRLRAQGKPVVAKQLPSGAILYLLVPPDAQDAAIEQACEELRQIAVVGPTPDAVDDRLIESLQLPKQAVLALEDNGITTLSQLRGMSELDLLAIMPRLNRTSIKMLRRYLKLK